MTHPPSAPTLAPASSPLLLLQCCFIASRSGITRSSPATSVAAASLLCAANIFFTTSSTGSCSSSLSDALCGCLAVAARSFAAPAGEGGTGAFCLGATFRRGSPEILYALNLAAVAPERAGGDATAGPLSCCFAALPSSWRPASAGGYGLGDPWSVLSLMLAAGRMVVVVKGRWWCGNVSTKPWHQCLF